MDPRNSNRSLLDSNSICNFISVYFIFSMLQVPDIFPSVPFPTVLFFRSFEIIPPCLVSDIYL